FRIEHVDEVDDEKAAEVAQSNLTRHLRNGLEIRLEDRLLEILLADVFAGVDVDRDERLGLMDDDRSSRRERNAALERVLDLGLHAEPLEESSSRPVELEPVGERRRGRADELRDPVMR